MKTLFVLITFLTIQSSSFAQITDDSLALQAAIDVRNEFVESLENKDFTAFARRGLDGAIQRLADQIKSERHDLELADELLRNWEGSKANFDERLNSKMNDLGDHDPLFPWINTFLDKMASRYGTIIYNLPIVKDLQMMNYSIPVVFRPHGPWQNDPVSQGLDLRIEYRKHFIPFANLVTYYVTLVGCEYVAQHQGQPELKKVCKPVAEKLKYAMGRYIAPVVSDWIFSASNQSLQIGPERLKYNTVEDLRKAIKGNRG